VVVMDLDTTIRQAEISDADAIAALSGQLGYPVHTETVKHWLERFIHHPDHACGWRRRDDRSWDGYMHTKRYLYGHVFAEIGGIVVDEKHRGTSVGQMLMAECETWAKKQGCAYVRARSGSTRTGAHAFYKKIG